MLILNLIPSFLPGYDDHMFVVLLGLDAEAGGGLPLEDHVLHPDRARGLYGQTGT